MSNPYNQDPYGAPQYGAPPAQYGAAPQYVAPPMAPSTNGMAIASLICAFLFWPLGIIFGHIALGQIKRSNGMQGGRGLAIAGLILSYIALASVVLIIVLTIIAAAAASTATPS